MLQFSLRSLLVIYTALILLVALPSFFPWLPGVVQLVLAVAIFLAAVGGLALLPFAAIVALAVWMTPDEKSLRAANLRRAVGLVFLCLFALAPLASLIVHASTRPGAAAQEVGDW